MPDKYLRPDYIFEVSWEVCNKVGGIYTVISTKAATLEKEYHDNFMLIGPDVWKGPGDNPEFIEDKTLFGAWREHIAGEGLKVKIGRWNIPGKPVAILVDFTPYYVQKNEIFTHLWIKYQLDSLSGQWDYIEPALFGYAAGVVIECFYRFHLNYTDRIIAQFHEWMTGAGILYLEEKAPQIATVFTTHATVVSRCIAGNGLPFYSRFDSYDADDIARNFNVVSKHSLEKQSAHFSDCFTTVSELTAKECERFLLKAPDIITPNGFDNDIIPDGARFEKDRAAARKKIIQVAEGLLNQQLEDDSMLIIKSGRYEFKNKGIDVFIESLRELDNNPKLNKHVVAFIFVPANQMGPRKEVLERIKQPDFSNPVSGEVLTHYLQGAENDPIIKSLEQNDLDNASGHKVKVVFVPTYLDGNDGIFNVQYYDLLIGFDFAVFPSYYEPWGYTPLESLAFHIPSITTDVSGFGMVLKHYFNSSRKGVYIIHRTDDNEREVAIGIAGKLLEFSKKPDAEIQEMRNDAFDISKEFLWDRQLGNYIAAYNIALQKSELREELYKNKPQAEPVQAYERVRLQPVWRKIVVQAEFPENLLPLRDLAANFWWSWNTDARYLFQSIDPELWSNCQESPVQFLQMLDYINLQRLSRDIVFLETLQAVNKRFRQYMDQNPEGMAIAYFCMEYGIESFLKLYSGGLGVLAGDYLKQASDDKVNMLAIGLLYKNGYFRQLLSPHGEQLNLEDRQEVATLPLTMITTGSGEPMLISINFPGRTLFSRVWKAQVGRVDLYLLDTSIPLNSPEDQVVTDQLYGGDIEMRLKQEMLLGIGGVKLLDQLGIQRDVYHCNEGHAAFVSLERLSNLVQHEHLSFDEAFEVIKASTLFTTHTSVPAANDVFTEEMMRAYLSQYPHIFNISWERFMALGQAYATNANEKFSMTYLAAHCSQAINAVSRIHHRVSCELLDPLWPDYKPDELHIDYITNGVHYATWTAPRNQQLYRNATGVVPEEVPMAQVNWKSLYNVPDRTIWEMRHELKTTFINSLKARLSSDMTGRHENPKTILELENMLDPDALLIGFARRMVQYKRPALLFYDLERLSAIVNNTERPVQIFFAGKAHPNDGISKDIIRQIIEITQHPELKGKVIFLDDYDMILAKILLSGVDIWLNTPERKMEASGTSGMKAALNGVLNFSILDGWWAEAYKPETGWAIRTGRTYDNADFQNELDAETLYSILQNEIIPLYFNRNTEGLPVEWIRRIKSSIVAIAPQYSMGRVMAEYVNTYKRLAERKSRLQCNEFELTKQLTQWKRNVAANWSSIEILNTGITNNKGAIGSELYAKVILNTGELSFNDIGVEIVISEKYKNTEEIRTQELQVTEIDKARLTYEAIVPFSQPGEYEFAFRIYPRNPELPNRMDFSLVTWT
jgi:phosphorylase/glycogen(starch) synthase